MTTIRPLCSNDLYVTLFRKEITPLKSQVADIMKYQDVALTAVCPNNQVMGYGAAHVYEDGLQKHCQITNLRYLSPKIGVLLLKAIEEKAAKIGNVEELHVLLSPEYVDFFKHLRFEISEMPDRYLDQPPCDFLTKKLSKRTDVVYEEDSNLVDATAEEAATSMTGLSYAFRPNQNVIEMMQFGTFRCTALSSPPPPAAFAASKPAPKDTTATKAKPAEKAKPAAKANPPSTIPLTEVQASIGSPKRKELWAPKVLTPSSTTIPGSKGNSFTQQKMVTGNPSPKYTQKWIPKKSFASSIPVAEAIQQMNTHLGVQRRPDSDVTAFANADGDAGCVSEMLLKPSFEKSTDTKDETSAAIAKPAAKAKATAEAKDETSAAKAEPAAKATAEAKPPSIIPATTFDTAVEKTGESEATREKVENVNANGASVEKLCHPNRKKTSHRKSDKAGKTAALCLNERLAASGAAEAVNERLAVQSNFLVSVRVFLIGVLILSWLPHCL